MLISSDPEVFQRLALLILSYGSYYYIITSLATYFSARLKNNTSALSAILATWILWTIFLPKIWGNAVEKIHPLPSRMAFKAAMKEERSKGIDGHNPTDKRREELKGKYLAEYEVDSLKNLPINFDGIVMQEDEEYGNMVWDKHFGNNYNILQKQKFLYHVVFNTDETLFVDGFSSAERFQLNMLVKACDLPRYGLNLEEKNQYLVDFNSIPTEIAKKAKTLWLNYPNNPTGAIAPMSFFKEAVKFCKEFDIALLLSLIHI